MWNLPPGCSATPPPGLVPHRWTLDTQRGPGSSDAYLERCGTTAAPGAHGLRVIAEPVWQPGRDEPLRGMSGVVEWPTGELARQRRHPPRTLRQLRPPDRPPDLGTRSPDPGCVSTTPGPPIFNASCRLRNRNAATGTPSSRMAKRRARMIEALGRTDPAAAPDALTEDPGRGNTFLEAP